MVSCVRTFPWFSNEPTTRLPPKASKPEKFSEFYRFFGFVGSFIFCVLWREAFDSFDVSHAAYDLPYILWCFFDALTSSFDVL